MGRPTEISPGCAVPSPSAKSPPTKSGERAPSVKASTAAAFAARPGGSVSSTTTTSRSAASPFVLMAGFEQMSGQLATSPYDRWMPPLLTELDPVDQAILRALQDDARQTNRDLAAAVHVSPSTSSERVRALRAERVIRGYHADIDFGALGRHVQALTAVTIRPPTRENVEAFRNFVNELPELVGVFVVSGSADFLLHVAVPDTNALYAFVIDRLTGRPEVAGVNTSVVYEHVRRAVLEPLGGEPGGMVRTVRRLA